jgi:hypothetical protein
MPAKHEELAEQLTSWWHTQADFKRKKALAGFLKVHPDTLGEYFSGKSFPRLDIANRLFELTNLECLKPEVGISTAPPNLLKEERHLGKSSEALAGPLPGKLNLKEGRYGERSIVISLQRTKCPFCSNEITRFRNCAYCGQHFIWANVPLEYSEPL